MSDAKKKKTKIRHPREINKNKNNKKYISQGANMKGMAHFQHGRSQNYTMNRQIYKRGYTATVGFHCNYDVKL